MAVLFISSMLTSVRVFMWLLWGELCFHMFTNADVMSVVYFCMCVLACVSWLCPVEFPENPESTHLITTHHIVTPSPRYGTHSVHPALPSLLHFPLLWLLNMQFFFVF